MSRYTFGLILIFSMALFVSVTSTVFATTYVATDWTTFSAAVNSAGITNPAEIDVTGDVQPPGSGSKTVSPNISVVLLGDSTNGGGTFTQPTGGTYKLIFNGPITAPAHKIFSGSLPGK